MSDFYMSDFPQRLMNRMEKKCSDLFDVILMKEVYYEKVLTEFPNVQQ